VINSETLAALELTAAKRYTTSLPPFRRFMRFVCKATTLLKQIRRFQKKPLCRDPSKYSVSCM
jgi:hypothetical protein